MPIPPRGNPRRPLAVAIRSTRILGVIFLGLGALFLWPAARIFRAGAGALSFVWIFTALCYVIPGVGYMILSAFLSRRQPWAIVVTMILASLNAIFIILGLTLVAFVFVIGERGRWFSALVMLTFILFLITLVQLILNLGGSFESLRHPDEPVGFQPLLAQPAPVRREPANSVMPPPLT